MTITLVCRDESHEHKQATLRVLTRNGDGSWAAEGHRRPGSSVYAVPKRTFRDIAADKPVTVGDVASGAKVDRRRFEAECPLCGIKVVAHEDRVVGILNQLDSAGVSVLTLTALAARLA